MAIQGSNCTYLIGNITTDGSYNMSRAKSEVDTKSEYDSIGALHFIVAVIVVYGVAVIGVFILGHFRRRGKHLNQDLDKQANYFLKQMPTIRETIEKRQRLCSVHHILPNNMSYAQSRKRMAEVGDGILNYISIPLLVNDVSSKQTNGITSQSHEMESGSGRMETINETSSSVNSWAEVITEVDAAANDDLEDDVFMNSCERRSFGVDIYIKD